MFGDQAPGNAGALGVKLMRAMTGFAKQDKTGIADQLHQAVVVIHRPANRLGGGRDGLFDAVA